jgi:hypothetical protein
VTSVPDQLLWAILVVASALPNCNFADLQPQVRFALSTPAVSAGRAVPAGGVASPAGLESARSSSPGFAARDGDQPGIEAWRIWIGPVTDLHAGHAILGATVDCGAGPSPTSIIFSYGTDPEFASDTRAVTQSASCESDVQRFRAVISALPGPGTRMYARAFLTGPSGTRRSATLLFIPAP